MPTLEHSTGVHATAPAAADALSWPSGRMAAAGAAAGFVLMAVSGVLFYAAAGFSAQVNSYPAALVAAGGSWPALIRIACLVDMLGYLLLAPGAMYLRHRFRNDPLNDLCAVAGFAYILIGAIGAVMFATAGPLLMHDYLSASGTQRASVITTFSTLYQSVVVGLWQTLEGIPGGVWLLGAGVSLYRARSRALALVSFTFGGLFLLLALVRMLGY